MNLTNNPIYKINLNSFNNSNIQRIILTMSNISISNIESLINSLKVVLLKHYYGTNIYDTIYIENRVDLDCENTLWFMRHNLMYNYFNEHFDALYFTENCNNITKLQISFKRFNKTQDNPIEIKKESLFYIIFIFIFILIVFALLIYLFVVL